ncbi:Dolichyl-phosphate-mannose-protein mannosyltransferase-domain-containing protein [Triangularia verruculosa]|uniref:Dolichyl-phosphate-mannose--protein mannosyltransferase n=1 Tax=Triangularia verruculosa TaxID=2587418 RepID=A0AAN6XIX0_9PEZI|nr:Dolichyl-phosphate-mannose-protein mannosyltransferase-domain-containing protein [Triangularia verruculosa]
MARSAAAKAASGRVSPPLPPNPAPTQPLQGSVSMSSKNKSKGDSKRPNDYTSEGVQDNDVFLLPGSDYQLLLGITFLAAAVRLFRIYQPTSVVFDEVHFGGFASKYIKGKFFMDVHPPLAKLMITLFGYLAGFDGSFDFKEIGKDYIEPGVPYVAMRLFPAICGILLAPTMFLTLKAAGCRSFTAAMGAGLIIFENGLLTQARLILLDSPLMITTAFTALAFISFTNQQELGPSRAFSPSWWFWLVMTGLGLGMTVSIKWVGLFTIAWVGGLTLVQLWVMWGDYKNVTIRTFSKHFLARAFCLIVIPMTFYMAMFGIHFLCLVNPGEGDGFMSSEFQSTLNSKGMQDVPADVLMGSKVSIRHVNTQGGYLHSHPLMYPTGSKQQQITLYPHKDDNNLWFLENQTQPLGADGLPINGTSAWNNLEETPYIKNGGIIRIYHVPTHRRLHSHDVRPPVTEAEWQNEVSAYGYEGFDGDANDFFRVEIVKKKSKSGVAQERLRTIDTKFRLVHVMTGCVLFSHKVKLPAWASEQQEVTCARGGTLPNSLWYIESNEHAKLGPDAEKVNYANPGFLGKFWELQKVMWKTNAGLVESHAWDSRPDSWPILRRGINFWGKNHRQIYLIGNPIVWWSATAAVVIYVLFKGIAVLRWQRNFNDYADTVFKRFDYEIGTSVLGWALHYFPFYLMQRQLFLHHYFPALYFSVIAFCQVYDFVVARISAFGLKKNPLIGKAGALLFLVISIAAFTLLSPLAYGNTWTKAECKRVKLFDTWDWDCNTFLDSYDAYNQLANSPVAASPTSTSKPSVNVQAPAPAENPVAAGEQAKVPAVEQPQEKVSGAPVDDQRIVHTEERVEYRDQDGNLLDIEQVKALEGKVEFKTRYETRTRIIDAAGNEVFVGAEDEAPVPVAPPHPDVEGVDRETPQSLIPDESIPAAEKSVEGEKEAEGKVPKPASESKEKTAKEEL